MLWYNMLTVNIWRLDMDKEQAELMLQKVKAGILMLTEIQKDLESFLGTEIKEDNYIVEEEWLDDNGKVHKKGSPYIKAKSWYCCGKPLEKSTKNGKNIFHCSVCGSNYSA